LEASLNPQCRPAIIIGHKYTVIHTDCPLDSLLLVQLPHPRPPPPPSTLASGHSVRRPDSCRIPCRAYCLPRATSEKSYPPTQLYPVHTPLPPSKIPSLHLTLLVAQSQSQPPLPIHLHTSLSRNSSPLCDPRPFQAEPSRSRVLTVPSTAYLRLQQHIVGYFKQRLFGHTSILDKLSVVPSASRKGSYLPLRHPQSSYSRPSRQGYHSCLHKR